MTNREIPTYDAAMITNAALLARVEAHLSRTGELQSQFGIRVARDSNLVRDIRAGRSPGLDLAARIWEASAPRRSRRAAASVAHREGGAGVPDGKVALPSNSATERKK